MMAARQGEVSLLTDLKRLLAPVSEAEFLGHYHAKTRMLIRASEPTRAASLLPWDRIDALISSDTLPDERFSLIRDTNLLPAAFFRRGAKEKLMPGAVADLIAQGVSMVINDTAPLVPVIARLTGSIGRRLGCRVQCNTYISFGRQSAFRRHWDRHDVLVVQVHGRKKWQFLPGPVAYPLEHDKTLIDHKAPPEFETVIETGDVLYVPRGEVHVAEVIDEPSVHLTFSLVPPKGFDYIGHLREQAKAEPLFRMDLLRHLDREAAAAHEAALKQRLHELIDATPIADFLDADDLARPSVAWVSLRATAPAREQRLAPNLPRRIPLPESRPGGPDATLVIAGDKHRLPPAALAALGWLFDHEGGTAGRLRMALAPAHGGEAVEAGLLILLRRGLAVVLPD